MTIPSITPKPPGSPTPHPSSPDPLTHKVQKVAYYLFIAIAICTIPAVAVGILYFATPEIPTALIGAAVLITSLALAFFLDPDKNLSSSILKKKLVVLIKMHNGLMKDAQGKQLPESAVEKAFEVLRAKLLDAQRIQQLGFPSLSEKKIEKIQTYKPDLNTKKGVCFGAVACLAKTLLTTPPTSLLELLAKLKPYQKGFPAEAAALTKMQHLTLDDGALWKKLVPLAGLVPGDTETQAKKKIGRVWPQIKAWAALHSYTSQYYGLFPFVGLEIGSEWRLFKGMPHEKQAHDHIQALPLGVYGLQLSGPSSPSGHVLVYYKSSFGSYLIDPNCGLIDCKEADGLKIQELCGLYSHMFPNPYWVTVPIKLKSPKNPLSIAV